jgi:hypothetical protein
MHCNNNCLWQGLNGKNMGFIELWLYWTQIACIVMSSVLAMFMLWRYSLRKHSHILIWAVAWAFVALRVAVGLFFSISFLREFINDFLTITADLLWFFGLALLLEMPRTKKIVFPTVYLSIFSLVIFFIYFKLENQLMGAAVTTIFAHPILLFILFWYFHVCAEVTGYLGAKIISLSFLLWALGYIIFGVPYFGAGSSIAGVLGWSIGLIFRVMMFLGFTMMALKKK